MQKGFSLILIVLLIAVLGVGGYFVYSNYSGNQIKPVPIQASPIPQLTPTDETANWRTYTNTLVGFSIKYPEKLSYNEVRLQDSLYPFMPNVSAIEFVNQNNKREFGNSLLIRVFGIKDKNLNTDSLDLEKLSRHDFFPITNAEWKDIKIGNFNGRYIASTGGVLVGYSAILVVTDKIFYFNLYDYADDTYITSNDFNQILSTFKFLDDKSVSQLNCEKDDDCGIDPCACAAVRKESVGACATYCGEIVSKCVNKQCTLVPL